MKVISMLKDIENPIKWLFLGDSITHGAFHSNGMRDFTEHFRERMRWEMLRRHDAVLNMAFSGFKSTELLAETRRVLAFYAPDATFIMIGINDCAHGISVDTFASNLTAASRMLDEAGSEIIWVTPPLPNGTVYGANIPPFVDIIRSFAQKRGELLVDVYAEWSLAPVRRVYWLSDHIHPNAEGHIAIAQQIFRALDCFDPAAPTGRYYLP